MPTNLAAAVTYGGCGLDKLYVLTGELTADLQTARPLNTTANAPAGSLLVFHGLGVGQGFTKKPCVGC